MATEGGTLEPVTKKIVQEETGNERFDQPQRSAEYVKELLELSHESAINGDLEPVSLQKLQVPTDGHSTGPATAAYNSSEILHDVTLETIDNSESENFTEETSRVQNLSEQNCKDYEVDVLAETPREELHEMSENTTTSLNDEDAFYNERNEMMEEVQSKKAEYKNQMASDSPAYVLEDTDPENRSICDLPAKVHQGPNVGKREAGDREEYERITANEDTEEKKSAKEKINHQPMIEIQELKLLDCSQTETEALSSPDGMKGREEELITSEENKEKLEAALVEGAALQNCELVSECLQDDTYFENNKGNRLDNGKYTKKEILSQDVIKTSDIDEKQQPEPASTFIEETVGEEEKLEQSPYVASGNPGLETQISIEEQEKKTEKGKASDPMSVDELPPLPLSIEKSPQDNGESTNDQIAADDARDDEALFSPRDKIDNVPGEIILDKERGWPKVDKENEAQKEEISDTENSDVLPTTIEDEIQPPNEAKESEDINKRTSEVVAEENIQHKSTEEESLAPSSNECGCGLFDDAATVEFSNNEHSACEEDHNQEEVLHEMKVQIMNCTVLEASEPQIEDHLKQTEAKSDIDNQTSEIFDNSQTELISDTEASQHVSFNKDTDDLLVDHAGRENLQAPDKHVDKTIYGEAFEPEPESAETADEKHENLYEPLAKELETTKEAPNIEKESTENIELVKHVEESSKEEEKEPHNNDVDRVESISRQQHAEITDTTFETEDETHTAVKVEGDLTTRTEVVEVLDPEKDLDEMKVQIMNSFTVLEVPHNEDQLKQIEAKSDIDNQKLEVFDDSQTESISDIEAPCHVSFNKDADDLSIDHADRENLQASDKHVDKTIYGEAFKPEPKSAETADGKHESLYEPLAEELETTEEAPDFEKESTENIKLVKHVEESSKEEEKEPNNNDVDRVESMSGQQHAEITDTTFETEDETHTAVKVEGDLTTRTEVVEVLDQEKDLDEMKDQIMNSFPALEASEPHIEDHLKQIEAKSDIDNQKSEVFDDGQTESISDIQASCHVNFNKHDDDLPVDHADRENLQASDKHVDKTIYGEAFKPEPKSAETADEKHESLYEPLAEELETTEEAPDFEKESAENIKLVKHVEESSKEEEKEPNNNDVDRVESTSGQKHAEITDTTFETEDETHTAVKVEGDLTTRTEVVEVLDQEKDLDEMKDQIMNSFTALEASEPHIEDHLKQIEAKSDIDNQKSEVFDDGQTESISDIQASCHVSFNKHDDDLPVDHADRENLQTSDKHVDKTIYGEAFKPEPKSAETADEKHESPYEPLAEELETTEEDLNVEKEHAENIELVEHVKQRSEEEEKELHNNDVDRVESMLGQQHVEITDTTVETEDETHTAVKVEGDLTIGTEVIELKQEIIEKNWIGTDFPCESKIHDVEKYADVKDIGASTENDSMEEVICDVSSSQVRMGARTDMGDASDNVCATTIGEKIGTPEEVAEKGFDERTDGKSMENTMLEAEANVEEKEMRTGADQIGCLKYSAEIAGEQQKSSFGEATVEEICLEETRNTEMGTSVMQKAKWEDKPANLTDVVPEKDIMAEERCSIEVHEMIQAQHTQENGEVNEQVEQEVVGVYTEGPCCEQITKLEEISQSADTDDGGEMVNLKGEDNFNNSEAPSPYLTLSQYVHQTDDQNEATLKPGLEEQLQETTHTEEAILIDNKPAHEEQIQETTNTGEMVSIEAKMEADDEVEATARWNQLVPDSEPQCKSQEMTSEIEADMIEQSIIEVKHHDLVMDKDNQDCNVAGIPLAANPLQIAFDEKHDKKAESKDPDYMNQITSDSAEYVLEDTNPEERSIHNLPAELTQDPFVGKYEAGDMEENEVKEEMKSEEEILEKQQKLEATSEVQEAKFPESSQAEPKVCVSLDAAKDSEEELKTIVEEKKEQLEVVSLEAASIQISEQLGECLQKGTRLENEERDSVNDGIYMQNVILPQDVIKTADIEQAHQNVLAYASIEEGIDEEEKPKESSSVASGKLVPEAQVSIEEQETAIEKGDTFASKAVNELPFQQLSVGKSPPDIGESTEDQIAIDAARDNVAMQSPRDEASVAPSVDYVPEETILNQEGEQQTDDMEHEALKEEKTNTENSDASSTKIKDLILSPEEAKESENPTKGTFEIVADEDVQDNSTEEESTVPSSYKSGHEQESATSLAKDIQSAYEEEQNHEKVLDEVKVQILNCSTPEASKDSEPHIESHLKELEAKEIDNQKLGVLEESQTEPTTDIEASIDLNADNNAEDLSVGCTSREYLQQAPDTSSESVEKRINDESNEHADKRINNEIIERVDKIIDEETLDAGPKRAETVDENHESLYKPEPKELETTEKDLNTEKESVENDELVKHVEGSSQEEEKEFDNNEVVTVESMPGFQHAAKTDITIQTENDTHQRKDQNGTTLKPGLKEQIQEATDAEDSTVIDIKHAHVEQIQELTVKPEAIMVDSPTDEDHVANTQIHALVDSSKETQTTKTENENEDRFVDMLKSRTECTDAGIVSRLIPDDQSQEANPSETKTENITNDDDVDNMLPPVIDPNKHIDTSNSTSKFDIHVMDPETTHDVVGETEVDFNQETTRSEKSRSTSASNTADQNQEMTLDAETFQTGTMMDADLHNNMITRKEDLCASAEDANVQAEGNLNKTDVNTSSTYMLISEGALDNVGGKYEKHSNSEYEEKDQTTSTKLNVEVDVAHDQQEMPEIISEQMPENQNQQSGAETETTEIEKKTYDEMLNKWTGSLSNSECLTEDNMQKDVEEHKNESSEVDEYMEKPILEDDKITTSRSSTETTVENSMSGEESRTSRSFLNQDEKRSEGINLDENIDQLTSMDEGTSDKTCKPNLVAGRQDRSVDVDSEEHITWEKAASDASNDINIKSDIDEDGCIDTQGYKFKGSAAETSYGDQPNESNEETHPIQNADGDEKLTDSHLPSEGHNFEREADNEPPKMALEDAQTEPAPDEDVNHVNQNKDLGCVPENDECNLSKSAGDLTLVSQLADEAQQEKQHDVGPGFPDVKKVAESIKTEVSIDLDTLREDKVGQHEETSTLVSEDLNQKHMDEIGVTKSGTTEDEAMTSETSFTEYKEEIHELKKVNKSKECLAIVDAKTTDAAAVESSKQPQGIMDEKQNDAYGPGIKDLLEAKVTINNQVMLEEEECISITTANQGDDPVTILNTTEAIEKEIAKGKMSEESIDLTNQKNPSITLDHISNNSNSGEVISQIETSTPHGQVDNIETEEKCETITNKHEELQEQNETSVEDSKKGTKECVEPEEYPEMIFERTKTNNSNEKCEEITGTDSCAESPETGGLEDEVTKEYSTEKVNTAKHVEAETLSETQETHAMTNQNYEVKESDLAKSETNLVNVSEDDKVVTESSMQNSENNIIVPPSTIASAEETVSQELREMFVRGYESEPKEYHQEMVYANKRAEELATEETKSTEGTIELASVHETCDANGVTDGNNVKGEGIPNDANTSLVASQASAGNNIDTTVGEDMAEKVAVDENESSSSKKIENEKNSESFSAIQTTDVSILQATCDIADQVTELNHEVGKPDRSEGEENQQSNLNDLPVSRFLMDHILQEEGDMPAEVCVSETQNKTEEEHTCDKDNNASIPEEEHIVDSFSTEKEAAKQSISEIKDLEKLEISPEALHEEQRHDAKGYTEIAAKCAEATQNDLCLPPSIMAIEEVEPEVSNLVIEQSTRSVTTNCNELMPTEESTVNLVEDVKLDEAVSKLRTTESAVPNNNDYQYKDVEDLTMIGICEENLLRGGDKREVSGDCKHISKDAHATPQEQAPTMPHLLKSSSCLVQSEEQFPDPHCEHTENISQPSTTEATKHGESSLNEGSDVREVTSREQNQDELTGNQVKNDSEEPKPSALKNVQPSDFMQVTQHEAVQLAEHVSEERSPPVIADDGETEKTTGAKVVEQETHDEKDERGEDNPQKTEENAPMILGSRDAGLKPVHKKSHILSGVGSKVKHSIAKMKMAITCNSAHHTAI